MTELHNAVLEAGYVAVEPVELIEFDSAGKCLLIGPAVQLQALIPRLSSLELYCYATDKAGLEAADAVTIIRQPLQDLSGWLGAFKALFADSTLSVDMVLDLGDKPMIGTKVPPLGYFAPGGDEQVLVEALQQLPELVGGFDKPRFFNYNADICAHSRRGIQACTNCIDACPAEAVFSSGQDLINVNPSLCQGCGSCTVVCPSGAISYALPTLDVSINRLRRMLQTFAEHSELTPHLLIHDESQAQTMLESYHYALPEQMVPFSIEEIGALGMAFWLSALAFGVGRITVWDAQTHPDHDWQELQSSIDESNHLIAALGYGEARIHWIQTRQFDVLQQWLDKKTEAMPVIPARFAGVDDKRRMITMALTHLHQQAPAPERETPLSSTAAFGEILVDKQACTLCMSCVSVCPVGALVDGVDKPQLNFIEDLCVQCGMCETACPEDAIDLKPRYLFERDEARQKRVLNEEPVFHCIGCHKPFATQKMIDTMIAKLGDHPMFQGAALERLKMCEDCRVKAMFKDSQGPM